MFEIIDEIRPLKEERRKLRWGVLFGIVCLIVLFVAATWPTKAHAQTPPLLYSDPQVSLRITDRPCHESVLKFLNPDLQPFYRSADMVWEGRPLKACWRATESKEIRVVDEEGDQLKPDIPLGMFKGELGA